MISFLCAVDVTALILHVLPLIQHNNCRNMCVMLHAPHLVSQSMAKNLLTLGWTLAAIMEFNAMPPSLNLRDDTLVIVAAFCHGCAVGSPAGL